MEEADGPRGEVERLHFRGGGPDPPLQALPRLTLPNFGGRSWREGTKLTSLGLLPSPAGVQQKDTQPTPVLLLLIL